MILTSLRISAMQRNSFNKGEPETQLLYKCDDLEFLELWALSTDSLFGGTSKCELGLTKNNTCMLHCTDKHPLTQYAFYFKHKQSLKRFI